MASRPWVQPVELEGSIVRLEPLSLDHLSDLTEVGLDAELWRWTLASIASPADMRAYVSAALAAATEGREVPFVIIELASGRAVGSTRFLSIDSHHRRLEIGYTWIGRAWQGGAVNTESKLLLLAHAFNNLGALRVEFKTDSLNERSRTALLALGAMEEGTLRNHMVTGTGRRRHSVYYSVIEEEWPQVRMHLEARLARLMSSAEQAAGQAGGRAGSVAGC